MKPQFQRPTAAFIGASWAALMVGGITYLAGLWNAGFERSEKGFYAMSFVLCLFAAVAIQKNVRDTAPLGPNLEKDEQPANQA